MDEKSVVTGCTRVLMPQAAHLRHKKNQEILILTCLLFLFFCAAEFIGALKANSLSLLGDAVAMSIDVFTYICHIFVERLKCGEEEKSIRMRFTLEIIIPSMSLLCLLGIMGYIAAEAFHVLLLPEAQHEEVNIYFLFGFSIVNAIIDIISSYSFWRNGGHDVFISYQSQKTTTSYRGLEEDVELRESNSIGEQKYDNSVTLTDSKVDLNMLSAFTHLAGDSLRTISVFIAALVSMISGISSQKCDAWAAVFVTFTIFAMVLPLGLEIYKTSVMLRGRYVLV